MNIPTPKEKHDHATLDFPEGFLWGTGTSAHQVEGNNVNNDWWEWEQRVQPPDKRSEQACNQYELFEQDIQLVKDFGHNAHRLSIEWSRIEPEEGLFNETAILHYQQELKSLKAKDISVMLTLFHFTIPLWLAKKGGWENGQAVKYFERFVKKMVPLLKDYVDFWITINEPGVYSWACFEEGKWPPQKKSRLLNFKVYWNLAQAHKKAYKIIHQEVHNAKVGIANNVTSIDSFHQHSLLEGAAVWGYDFVYNHIFYKLTGIKSHDFLGLNYYLNSYISFGGETRLPKLVDMVIINQDVSDLGWEIYPEGIFDIIMDFSDYHLPIYITENGIASTNDDRRVRFLLGYLKEIYHAIALGVKVKGYFHWSLLDNFEWADGFTPRFGLVEIDFNTQKRTPRPSAYVYKEIAKSNGIPHYLLKLLGHGIRVEEVIKI